MTTQPEVEIPSLGPGLRAPIARHRAPWPEVDLRAPFDTPGQGDVPWRDANLADIPPLQAKLIILIDALAFTRECTFKCLTAICPEITIRSFSTVQECLGSSLEAGRPCVILYNVHAGAVMEPEIAQSLARLQTAFDSFPIVILSDLDRADCVQEALQRGARGYIPTTSTTLDVAAEVIRLVRVGGTFMPATSATAETNGRNGGSKSGLEGQFTPRQIAVLNHLRQGKANKIIAHELQMSESTVKVHVRNIMKKMKATNRTEVAFRAQTLKALV
jgi:DNA-binding NarL/FixJ family response regulator